MHQAINSYLGIPYQYGGSTHHGMDCSGLVMKVYQRAGIELPRTAQEQANSGKKVGIGDLEFGDVLVFRDTQKEENKKVSHVGLFMGEGRFVHASKSRGVVVDSLNSRYWRDRFVEGRRVYE